MSVGRPPGFLCDVQQKIAAARWWILMSWKRDVIWWREVVERGCGERFQLLGTEISTHASRSRAEPVPPLLFEVRLELRNDGTSVCPKEKFMCRVSTKGQCEKDEEH
jgi:hypothetical protein